MVSKNPRRYVGNPRDIENDVDDIEKSLHKRVLVLFQYSLSFFFSK